MRQITPANHAIDTHWLAGSPARDASLIYDYFAKTNTEQLLTEAQEIEYMPPIDPDLPQQLAIDKETIARVFINLSHHSVTVLEAPSDLSFILGDTPFPPELGKGFVIPISSRLALLWEPGNMEAFSDWNRRTATKSELESSNQTQSDNALKIAIGCSKAVLEKYV